ncbi:hypothetical protein NDU88_004251 [Pleurodeles waltl]|uniref:Uncharacterized protein n=1 Tax=Pleurodeles waltl TaxID=8319 RepID=A0AAV7PDG7_PLEWA|nr:hypothetical protein NDU88_004251 [Pleurodeles waltl]
MRGSAENQQRSGQCGSQYLFPEPLRRALPSTSGFREKLLQKGRKALSWRPLMNTKKLDCLRLPKSPQRPKFRSRSISRLFAAELGPGCLLGPRCLPDENLYLTQAIVGAMPAPKQGGE